MSEEDKVLDDMFERQKKLLDLQEKAINDNCEFFERICVAIEKVVEKILKEWK